MLPRRLRQRRPLRLSENKRTRACYKKVSRGRISELCERTFERTSRKAVTRFFRWPGEVCYRSLLLTLQPYHTDSRLSNNPLQTFRNRARSSAQRVYLAATSVEYQCSTAFRKGYGKSFCADLCGCSVDFWVYRLLEESKNRPERGTSGSFSIGYQRPLPAEKDRGDGFEQSSTSREPEAVNPADFGQAASFAGTNLCRHKSMPAQIY